MRTRELKKKQRELQEERAKAYNKTITPYDLKLEVLAADIDKQIKEQGRARCKQCGAHTKYKNIVLVKDHYYTRPYSCNEGDYWSFSAWNWECPKCGFETKISSSYSFEGKEFFPAIVSRHGKKLKVIRQNYRDIG